MGQRKGRLYRVVDLTQLRTERGLTLKELGLRFIPPVSVSYMSQLESGEAMASGPSLMDLARIFGKIQVVDEYGHQYLLVYQGRRSPAIGPEDEPA